MTHCIVCKNETSMLIDVKNTNAERIARDIQKELIPADATSILYCEKCLQHEFELEPEINVSSLEWDGSGNISSSTTGGSRDENSAPTGESRNESIVHLSSQEENHQEEIKIKPGPKCFKNSQLAKIRERRKRDAPDNVESPSKRQRRSDNSRANESSVIIPPSPVAGPSNYRPPSAPPPPVIQEVQNVSRSSSDISVGSIQRIDPNNQVMEQINSNLETPPAVPQRPTAPPRIYNRVVPVEPDSDDDEVLIVPNHPYIPQGAPLRQRNLPPDDLIIMRKRVNGG